MIEDGFLALDLVPEKPVASLHEVSHDPSLTYQVPLRSGRRLTAVQMQMEYCEQARKYVEDRHGDDTDDVTRDVLDRWESVLTRLEGDRMQLSRELDWVAKLEVLEGYRTRDGLDWSSSRLQLVDLQYSDVRPTRVCTTGWSSVAACSVSWPRRRSSARSPGHRGHPGLLPRALPGQVRAERRRRVVGFGHFDLPGRESLQRVPTLEPLRGTRAHVGDLLDRCDTAVDLVAALTGEPPAGRRTGGVTGASSPPMTRVGISRRHPASSPSEVIGRG